MPIVGFLLLLPYSCLVVMNQYLERLKKEARDLPKIPGVYLMKDEKDCVLYVGKASSIQDRVSSYFNPSANLGPRKQPLLDQVAVVEIIKCEDEWEALLTESRLIKDLRPRFNSMMMDDKTYPYLVVTMSEDFPKVIVTRTPADSCYKGARVFGPFTSVSELRQSVHLMQRIFKYRTCSLDIKESEPKNKSFRPCLLYATDQCTAPCNDQISRDGYREDIDDFIRFLNSKRSSMIKELKKEMENFSSCKEYEKAAIKRDQMRAIQNLDQRLKSHEDMWQTEVTMFSGDPANGILALQKVLDLENPVRCIEAFDIAHLAGKETVGAKACFIDGRPFKQKYRKYKIKTASNDDYAAMREIIIRRYREAGQGLELFPDVILIDGGKGQLSAAREAFDLLESKPPCVIGLAKKEEEIFLMDRSSPLKLSRNHTGLKLCQAIRDEAHRFARSYHHLLRQKSFFQEDS